MRAILAFLLLTSSAIGADGICQERYTPPAEFVYEPAVDYTVIHWPDDWMQEQCLRTKLPWAPVGFMRGCADPPAADGYWYIYVNETLDATQRGCVLRHEKAHINGWRHPGKFDYTLRGPMFRRAINYERRWATGYPN